MRPVFATALRLRRLAVDQARQELARRLATEAEAAEAERQAAYAIQHEAMAATEAHASDSDVEAFAAWLPHGRRALDRTRAMRSEAELACNIARAALAAAQAAAEAIETLLADEAAAARRQAANAEQRAVDETALQQWTARREPATR